MTDIGERLDSDPDVIRYGCFLPDLTGLARHLSTASLSGSYIDYQSLQRKAAGGFS